MNVVHLAIRMQPGHFARLTDLAQPARQLMRDENRHRHQIALHAGFNSLIGRIADGDALVAGAAAIHRQTDFLGLFLHDVEHRDRARAKLQHRIVVPDVIEHLPHCAGQIDVGVGRQFTG